MNENLTRISAAPHIRDKHNTTGIMGDVIIALMPAAIFGIYNFGIHAYLLIIVCMLSCMFFEAITQRIFKKPVTVRDLSAALTGLLLALNLPPEFPVWMAILGCAFAIIVVKQMFGGLGHNFMNPALAARCFLMMSFVGPMTRFTYDGITSATPLAVLKNGGEVDLLTMFLGTHGGTIGETSAAALLIGALYLLFKRVIDIRIPFVYIGTFFVCILVYALTAGEMNINDALYFSGAHICGGGLILGAFFMATDYVTSPITNGGKIIYGIILGALTFILRIYGGSAEGVSYAIIISNLLVPLIETVTVPKTFGKGAEKLSLSDNMGRLRKKDKKDKESIGKVVFAIFVICIISGLLLGAVYKITKAPIDEAAQREREASYNVVFPEAASYEVIENVSMDDVNLKISEMGHSGSEVDELLYALDENKNIMGYVFIITNSEGYSGDIQMAVGVDKDGTVTGLSMLAISETKGLGMEAKDDPSFAEQYIGKNVESFEVIKQGEPEENQILAISGATITTNAITNAVNAALGIAEYLTGGGAHE